MQNYLETRYPDLYKVYNDAIGFYRDQKNQMEKAVELINHDDNLYCFKLILFQFGFISIQDLESIFILLQNNQNFTPQIVLRSLYEYYATLVYILTEPKQNAEIYISRIPELQGKIHNVIRSDKKSYNALKKHNDDNFDARFEAKCLETKNEILKTEKLSKQWPKTMEQIVDFVKVDGFYFEYRLLSMYVHPNPFSLEDCFEKDDNNPLSRISNDESITKTLKEALVYTNHIMTWVNEYFGLSNSIEYEKIEAILLKMINANSKNNRTKR